jgi:putative membrane-bound dehydrogenase-like protein
MKMIPLVCALPFAPKGQRYGSPGQRPGNRGRRFCPHPPRALPWATIALPLRGERQQTKLVVTLLVLLLLPSFLHAQGYSPEDALKRMEVPDGLEVRLVAAEPLIRQPVTMTFDDKGRIWVIQYLQYPNPAGLKPVKVDEYLRTTYDRMPEQPPKGPKGADKVTILYDPDENGRFTKAKDFVTGLNLASGLCLGHGGAYVMQSPYLLFYPDRNGDDVPDSDPEVLLTGFGMEDSHAVANSLIWGPDGWLYGAHGSTCTAKIRNPAKPNEPSIEFQQGVWRYHPKTKEFELFAEGGGNTWGLDFDRHGNVIAGTNWGGFAMLHMVQGGYYVKGFAKHGPLHNPHAYGYFEHVPYTGFKGGHVTCGGIIYRGDALPASFRDTYIAGNLLSSEVHWHIMEPYKSTFKAKHGGVLLKANDNWFRPIDCLTGPDGALYIVDWYDKRANHVDPIDNWDRSNGRIYKITAKGRKTQPQLNLSKLSSEEQVKLLSHPNSWHVNEARRILGERRDPKVIPILKKMVLEEKGQLALEALWALYVSGGWNDEMIEAFLKHPSEDVRGRVYPLLSNQSATLSQTAWAYLRDRIEDEKSPAVRSRIASMCQKLDAHGSSIILSYLSENEFLKSDVDDPLIPLLVWWAIEKSALDRAGTISSIFIQHRDHPLFRKYLMERIVQRYMASKTPLGYRAVEEFLVFSSLDSPDRNHNVQADLQPILSGMEKALIAKQLSQVPPELEQQIERLWQNYPNHPLAIRVLIRMNYPKAKAQLLKLLRSSSTKEPDRLSLIELLGQLNKPEYVPTLLDLLKSAQKESLRLSLLSALQAYPDPQITDVVLTNYPQWSGNVRSRAKSLLLARPDSALKFLQAIDAGKISPKELSLDQLRPLTAFNREQITTIIEKHWGRIAPQTSGEKIARMRSIQGILGQGKGQTTNGKLLFTKNCATCHQLFGEGEKIGPDLTSVERQNRQLLVTNIIDPNAVIRPEQVAHVILADDGRLLTGMITEQTAETITLRNDKETVVLPRSRIEQMKPAGVSLMPEGLLDKFTDQELRDLFTYMQQAEKKR